MKDLPGSISAILPLTGEISVAKRQHSWTSPMVPANWKFVFAAWRSGRHSASVVQVFLTESSKKHKNKPYEEHGEDYFDLLAISYSIITILIQFIFYYSRKK